MKATISVVVLSVLLPLADCFAGEIGGVPGWYQDPPAIEGKIVAVATGEGKPEALTVALGELSGMSGASAFGNIAVSSLTEEFNGMHEQMTKVTKVLYRSGEDSTHVASMNYHYEDLGGSNLFAFEFLRENCDLGEIIAELKTNGVDITSYEGQGGRHYIMLIWTPAKPK